MNLRIRAAAFAAAVPLTAVSPTALAQAGDCTGCVNSTGEVDVGLPPAWSGASSQPWISIEATVLPGICDPNDCDTRRGCAATITRSWGGDFSFPGVGLGDFAAEVDIRGNTYEYQNTPPVTNDGGAFSIGWAQYDLTCGWEAVWRFEHARDIGPVTPGSTTVSTTGSCSLCQIPEE